MGCDGAPEAVELSRAEKAIIGILTQYYAEGLSFSGLLEEKDTYVPPILSDKNNNPLIDCESLIVDTAFSSAGIVSPKILVRWKKTSGYGSIYYLLTALALAEKGCYLESDIFRELSYGSSGLWQKFINLGLATPLENKPNFARFIDLNAVDIEFLKQKAEESSLDYYHKKGIRRRILTVLTEFIN